MDSNEKHNGDYTNKATTIHTAGGTGSSSSSSSSGGISSTVPAPRNPSSPAPQSQLDVDPTTSSSKTKKSTISMMAQDEAIKKAAKDSMRTTTTTPGGGEKSTTGRRSTSSGGVVGASSPSPSGDEAIKKAVKDSMMRHNNNASSGSGGGSGTGTGGGGVGGKHKSTTTPKAVTPTSIVQDILHLTSGNPDSAFATEEFVDDYTEHFGSTDLDTNSNHETAPTSASAVVRTTPATPAESLPSSSIPTELGQGADSSGSTAVAAAIAPVDGFAADEDEAYKNRLKNKMREDGRAVVESRPGPGFRDRMLDDDGDDDDDEEVVDEDDVYNSYPGDPAYPDHHGGRYNSENFTDEEELKSVRNVVSSHEYDASDIPKRESGGANPEDPFWSTLPIAAEVVPTTPPSGEDENKADLATYELAYATATAVPKEDVAKKRRQRLLLVFLMAVVVAIIVVVTVVVTRNNSENNGVSAQDFGNDKDNPAKNYDTPRHQFETYKFFPIADDNRSESALIGQYDGARYGSSVAISYKGNRLAVGAPGYDDDQSDHFPYVSIYDVRGKVNEYKFLVNIASDAKDGTGQSVSISDGGEYVAIGSPYYPSSSTGTVYPPGIVRVYQIYRNGTYEQVGNDITGSEQGDQFGSLVQLSTLGDIVAIASRGFPSCGVRAFRLNSTWEPYGQTIECASFSDQSTENYEIAMQLSSDGSTIILGEPKTNGTGIARVFKYDTNVSEWIQVGDTLYGVNVDDEFGYAVAIDSVGKGIGVCAPAFVVADSSVGRCTFYSLNTTATSVSPGGRWDQHGLHVYGQRLDVRFGSALSSIVFDFNARFVAISATDTGSGTNDGKSSRGCTLIYEYNPLELLWAPYGYSGIEDAGSSVALSYTKPELLTIAIGSPSNLTSPAAMGGTSSNISSSSSVMRGEVSLQKNLYVNVTGGVMVNVEFGTTGSDPYALFNWTLDRLDSYVSETMRILNKEDEESRAIQFVVPSEGVYRVSSSAGVFVQSIALDGRQLALVPADSPQQTFLARTWNDTVKEDLKGGENYIALTINFDENPQDIHWVLIAEDSLDTHRKIVAYGPDDRATYLPNRREEFRSIDVSDIIEQNKLTLVVTDDGENGFRNGDFQVNRLNGTTAENFERLNVTNKAWSRRYSNCFFVDNILCTCGCYPKEVSL